MLNFADIVVGICWGDEAKAKVVNHLANTGQYDVVARWAGGNNAGHTVYHDKKKYKVHLVPSGVFSNKISLVGPGCVLHPESFYQELKYLKYNNFDTSLVKVHPHTHIVTQAHIDADKSNIANKLGTTGKGIAYAYADKAARTGLQAKDVLDKSLIWDQELAGNILCEGAQGFWLDQDLGNYPYVTSSNTLPYAACSIGFPPQKIRNIYGCFKIYDTRSGQDPLFPDSLLEDPILSKIGEIGQEYGTTTGRRRKVQWLNIDALLKAIDISGSNILVCSKCDVLEELGIYRAFYNNKIVEFETIVDMTTYIENLIKEQCKLVEKVIFSSTPEAI